MIYLCSYNMIQKIESNLSEYVAGAFRDITRLASWFSNERFASLSFESYNLAYDIAESGTASITGSYVRIGKLNSRYFLIRWVDRTQINRQSFCHVTMKYFTLSIHTFKIRKIIIRYTRWNFYCPHKHGWSNLFDVFQLSHNDNNSAKNPNFLRIQKNAKQQVSTSKFYNRCTCQHFPIAHCLWNPAET